MSKLFYKYLVNKLIIGHFKNNVPKKGDKFVFTIEDDEHRAGIQDAFEKESEKVEVSGIFQSISDSVQEVSYNTLAINLGPGVPKLLLAMEEKAEEDYLNTIRNAVGNPDFSLEDYCVLYILSGVGLSSLITACEDIQGKLGPLSTEVISEVINHDFKEVITKDYELPYLSHYLESLSEDIETGSCDIFDFQNILAILQEEKLEGHFNDIGCFPDKRIYDSAFHLENKDMAQRAATNHDIFRRISVIMDSDALEQDKLKELYKILDEKLAKKIFKDPEWSKTDISAILDSIEKHNQIAKLEVTELCLVKDDRTVKIIQNIKGKWSRNSTTHIIICNPSDEEEVQLRISFNQKVGKAKTADCSVKGNEVTLTVKNELVSVSWGPDGNAHKFLVHHLHCTSAFFKDLGNQFVLKNKTITVNVPEDTDTLILGNGDRHEDLPLSEPLKWNDDYKVRIDAPEEDDVEKMKFDVDFGGKVMTIELKFNVAKGVPPMSAPTGILDVMYHPDPNSSDPCEKITDNERVFPTNKNWRRHLHAEYEFVTKGCHALKISTNNLTGNLEYDEIVLDLPSSVKEAYNDILAFMQDNETLPSLTPLKPELQTAYIKYIEAVDSAIRSIQDKAVLSDSQFNIGKLGTVEKDGRVYLSPLHPLLVAYELEYTSQTKGDTSVSSAKKLINPFYLIPYLYFNGTAMHPYRDTTLASLRNWLAYEKLTATGQYNAGEVAATMVEPRMSDFIKHSPHLFQDRECPLIINAVGITYDNYLVKGIVNFIIKHFDNGVQRIDLHDYRDNITEETFFEQINRLSSTEAIIEKLQELDINLDKSGIEPRDIVHALFTRVSFYKHSITPKGLAYCHISFYQMNTGDRLISHSLKASRSEASMKGLVSIPSTTNQGEHYVVGYGEKGMDKAVGHILPIAGSLNTLYANSEIKGEAYQTDISASKQFKFQSDEFLDDIYNKSNWVVFLNPEVDIQFFYRQNNVYLVHYTDQITVNAKYDSITITRQVEQYRNILRRPYENLGLSSEMFDHFNDTMIRYFNCLNGSWMLSIVDKTMVQVREKMSLVAATLAMKRFLRRIPDIIWVPVSLEEILRVTPSVGLKKDFIFTKSSIGATGPMSDDLLFIGLDTTIKDDLKLYLYPVEVKCSANPTSFLKKGDAQVAETFRQLRLNLTGPEFFIKRLYRTFFTSQFLNNAEKLCANGLLTEEEYSELEEVRFALLNDGFKIEEWLQDKKLGNAAVVSYHDQAIHEISTSVKDNVAICHIHLTEKESYKSIANPECEILSFLESDPIITDNQTNNFLRNPVAIVSDEEEIESNLVMDEDDDDIQIPISANEVIPPTEETNENQTSNDGGAEKSEQFGTDTDTDNRLELNIENEDVVHGPSSMNIVLGRTGANNNVVFEPNNTHKVSHPNMGIIGTMGTGKTQLARSIIAQFSKEAEHNVGQLPVGLLVFDYKGDYNKSDFLAPVGGEVYKYNFPFNPLKLVITPDTTAINLPAITADSISDSLAKAYGLGLKQQANIKQVILTTYADHGITRDPSTWGKVPPTMSDVIDKYFETYDTNDKSYALFDKLRDYTIFSEDQSHCVSLFEWLDRVRVIDLTSYPDDTKKVIVSLILDLFYAEMRQLGASAQESGFRQLRAMIMVDEAHQFLKKDFTSLRNIISEGRMFGVGMILSTQNISDFKTSKEDYTQFILSWMIHHVTTVSNSELASIFGAGDVNLDRYRTYINNAQLFESVCKIGRSVKAVKDLPFFELIQQDERFKSDC